VKYSGFLARTGAKRAYALAPAHLARSDHFHRFGDLLSILDLEILALTSFALA